MKHWSVFVQKNERVRKWVDDCGSGWYKDACGLSKWRVVNAIDAVALESGQESISVEMEGGLLSYLSWIFTTRVLHGKRMILPGWITEKGELRS